MIDFGRKSLVENDAGKYKEGSAELTILSERYSLQT